MRSSPLSKSNWVTSFLLWPQSSATTASFRFWLSAALTPNTTARWGLLPSFKTWQQYRCIAGGRPAFPDDQVPHTGGLAFVPGPVEETGDPFQLQAAKHFPNVVDRLRGVCRGKAVEHLQGNPGAPAQFQADFTVFATGVRQKQGFLVVRFTQLRSQLNTLDGFLLQVHSVTPSVAFPKFIFPKLSPSGSHP